MKQRKNDSEEEGNTETRYKERKKETTIEKTQKEKKT